MSGAKWTAVNRLAVSYRDDGEPQPVGELAKARVIAFQYGAAWLERGIELSPEHLPLTVGRDIMTPPNDARMHGLFVDALPDSWGERVMRMAFERHGVSWNNVSELDRLAALGARAMGALSFAPAAELGEAVASDVSLEGLLSTVDDLMSGEPSRVATLDLDKLRNVGGTAGGAQPKVLVGIRESDGSIALSSDLPRDFAPYLLKFSPKVARADIGPDIGRIEFAYAGMARDAGLDVPASRLEMTIGGRAHFAVARFDRTPTGGRRHVHSLAGLLGRKPADNYDYDELLRIILHLTGDNRALHEALARCLFNVLAGNDDDHGRNTSFLYEPSRGWTLSPAYDLVFQSGRGSRGMAVLGKESGITRRDILRLAKNHGIPVGAANAMLERVLAAVARWPERAHACGVPNDSRSEIESVMRERRRELLGD